SALTKRFSETVTTADLHLEFLDEMFKTFAFPASTITQLDAVLTSIVNQLKSLNLKWESTDQDVGFFTRFYYFEPVVGLPVKIPKIRLFYLHIDSASWNASIGKASAKKISFAMTYNDFVFSMNEDLMEHYKETISYQIKKLAGDKLKEIEAVLSPKTVSA
ncbi:18549_t:CDS:1, partial [Racocetra persica]